jgi:hypothetical protein
MIVLVEDYLFSSQTNSKALCIICGYKQVLKYIKYASIKLLFFNKKTFLL